MYLSGHFLTPRFRNFSKLPSGEVKWQYPPYTQKNCLTYIKTIDWIGNHGGKVLPQSWGIARTSDHETKIISILEKHIKSKEDLCEIPSKIVWTCLSESVQTFFPCSIILCFYIKINYYNFFLFICRVQVSHQLIWYVLSVVPFLEPGSIGVYFLIRSICIRKGKKNQFVISSGYLATAPTSFNFWTQDFYLPFFSKLQHRKESSFQKFPSSGWTFYLPRQKIHFLHLRFFHEWN